MKNQERLKDVHPALVDILLEVDRIIELNIIEGHRDPARQLKLFEEGKTKLKFGKHNKLPSHAVDCAPVNFDWANASAHSETYKLFFLYGVMETIAKQHGVKLRFGGDWDHDYLYNDQTFNDRVHFELDDIKVI